MACPRDAHRHHCRARLHGLPARDGERLGGDRRLRRGHRGQAGPAPALGLRRLRPRRAGRPGVRSLTGDLPRRFMGNMSSMTLASGFEPDVAIAAAAEIAVGSSLKLKEGETVLIVTNPAREALEIAAAMYDASVAAGAQARPRRAGRQDADGLRRGSGDRGLRVQARRLHIPIGGKAGQGPRGTSDSLRMGRRPNTTTYSTTSSTAPRRCGPSGRPASRGPCSRRLCP